MLSLGEENTSRIVRDFFEDKPYVVYKEVALSQVIEAKKNELSKREWVYYISSSFDFLVCLDEGNQPYELAIEYDSAFHDKPDRIWKDSLKDRLCEKADLP